jgi:hypothetical protein
MIRLDNTEIQTSSTKSLASWRAKDLPRLHISSQSCGPHWLITASWINSDVAHYAGYETCFRHSHAIIQTNCQLDGAKPLIKFIINSEYRFREKYWPTLVGYYYHWLKTIFSYRFLTVSLHISIVLYIRTSHAKEIISSFKTLYLKAF